MFGKVPKLAIVCVAAVALMLSATAAAPADHEPQPVCKSVTLDGHLIGLACFQRYGDWFEACDVRKDNLPVGVRFSYIRKNHSRQTGVHWHTAGVDGFGNTGPEGVPVRGCSYGNHNFGEGRPVWFQGCVRHPGGAEDCSKVQVAGA